MTFPVRKFGVEIEFIGVSQDKLEMALFDAGIPISGGKETAWDVREDCSISINRGMGYDECGELVSPILSGREGLLQLRKVVGLLKLAGGKVNRSCGLHVHVDARDLSAGAILGIAKRYRRFERDIGKWIARDRARNRFCRSLTARTINMISREIMNDGPERAFDDFDRYHKVNLASYLQHGTIEFRHHHGSVDKAEIGNWVEFLLNFVEKVNRDTPKGDIRITPVINYAARRSLWARLASGRRRTFTDLASASGFTVEEVKRIVKEEISTFVRTVELTGRSVRVPHQPHYYANLRHWTAYQNWYHSPSYSDVPDHQRAVLTSVLDSVSPGREDTVFDGIPSNVRRYYSRKVAAAG
jgi:hypothetical protein